MQFHRITGDPRVMDGVPCISGPGAAAHVPSDHMEHGQPGGCLTPTIIVAASRVACDTIADAGIHSHRWVSIL